MRTLVAALCSLVALAAGCGEEEREPAPREVTGLIVAVEGTGSDVPSFTVEARGRSYEILTASDVDYGFDLGHLREHERLAEPVRVRLEERDGRLYALRIDDA